MSEGCCRQKSEQIRNHVRDAYAEVARTGGCCGRVYETPLDEQSAALRVGYSEDEINSVMQGANLGLSCGNPQAIAELSEGEVVLDLGSGGGFDVFLSSKQVGETGRVIGVDMTPEMVSRARENARKGGYENVEFRLGEIEHIPAADSSIDVVISNCVINLSPDKEQVFTDAYRVLKPGGRIAITDNVATTQLPEEMRGDLELVSGCVAGAMYVPALEALLRHIGFTDVSVQPREESRGYIRERTPGVGAENYIASAYITARKPLIHDH